MVQLREVLFCFWWLQAVDVPVLLSLLLPGGVLAGVIVGVQVPGLPQGALRGVVPVLFPCQ